MHPEYSDPIRPPLRTGAAKLDGAVQTLALAAGVSSAAQDSGLLATAYLDQVEGRWLRVQSTVLTFICFGSSIMGAATATDWPMQPGVVYDFWLSPSQVSGNGTFFRAFSAAVATVSWYLG